MRIELACQAIRDGKCLELRYDGFARTVEVHAAGITKDDNPIMRVWQVSGGSQSNERVGWKLLRLDEILSATISNQNSNAPRRDYKRGDSAMERICCEI